MSDSNRTQLSLIKEVSWGVIPTSPAFQTMRNTSDGLTASLGYTSSEEIRADRQIPDVILVSQEASGDTAFEVSYAAFDDVLEGALFNTWSNVAEVENTASGTPITIDDVNDEYDIAGGTENFLPGSIVIASGFTNTANNGTFVAQAGTSGTVVASTADLVAETPPTGAKLKVVGFQSAANDLAISSGALTSSALDFTTLGLSVGDWIKIGGAATSEQFVTAANNAWVRISAIDTNQLSFDRGNSAFVNETLVSGETVRLFLGDKLINGVTEQSYTIERQYQSHSPVTYQYFRGMEVGELAISMEAQSIMSMTATWSGKDAILGADGVTPSTRAAGATDVAAPTNGVLNTSTNVTTLAVGGTEITGSNFVISANISVSNNLRQQTAVGSIGSIGIGSGTCEVTGEISTYFDDPTLYQQALNATESSFNTVFGDAAGNAMVLDIPSLRFSAGDPTIEGINSDITLPLSISAFRNSTLDYTIALQRFTTAGLI